MDSFLQVSSCQGFLQTSISVNNEGLKEKGSYHSATNHKLPPLYLESKVKLAADPCQWIVLNSALCLLRR